MIDFNLLVELAFLFGDSFVSHVEKNHMKNFKVSLETAWVYNSPDRGLTANELELTYPSFQVTNPGELKRICDYLDSHKNNPGSLAIHLRYITGILGSKSRGGGGKHQRRP